MFKLVAIASMWFFGGAWAANYAAYYGDLPSVFVPLIGAAAAAVSTGTYIHSRGMRVPRQLGVDKYVVPSPVGTP
jgi:hypothetical protein